MPEIADIIATERTHGGTATDVAARVYDALTGKQRAACATAWLTEQITAAEQAERLAAQKALFTGGSSPAANLRETTTGSPAPAVTPPPGRPRAKKHQMVNHFPDHLRRWHAFTRQRAPYLDKPVAEMTVDEMWKAVANLRANAEGQLRSAEQLEIIATACETAGVQVVADLPDDVAARIIDQIDQRADAA